jgi:DNA polymerase III gamma/tau subunit
MESIQSKLHILRISNPLSEQVKEVLDRIVVNEGIVIDEESKEYLMMISGGSIRILINFLEKIYILGEPVQIDLCKRICSSISTQEFETYLKNIQNNDIKGAIEVLYRIYDFGYSVIDILDYFFSFIKTTKLIDEETKYRVIPYLCKYITIFHNIHEDCIELALLTNNLQKIISNEN